MMVIKPEAVDCGLWLNEVDLSLDKLIFCVIDSVDDAYYLVRN